MTAHKRNPRLTLRQILPVVVLCALFVSQNSKAATSASPMDIIAVLDLSGSMNSGDGAERYEPLFQWIKSFMKPDDRIGAVAMGAGARLLSPLSEMEAFSFESMKGDLKHREKYTDLAAGLENAYYRLKSSPPSDREKLIVLFSDAKIDLAGGDWDVRNSMRYLLDRLIPSMKEDRIRIVAIVPDGLDADFQLLHELSDNTGGAYYRGLPVDALSVRTKIFSSKPVADASASAAAATPTTPESVSDSTPNAQTPVSSTPIGPSPSSSANTVVERVIHDGAATWMVVLFVIFGILLLGMLGLLVFMLRREKREPEPDTDTDTETELEKVLDDVQSLRQLSAQRRLSIPAIAEERQSKLGRVSEEPQARLSMSIVSPFLEFEDEPKVRTTPMPTDDISSRPAFAVDEKNDEDSNLSLSTMETMLGIPALDAEKHE